MAKSRNEKPSRFRPWLFKSMLLFALVGLFLAGLIWAGRWGLDQLRGRDRYDVPFRDIECEPPVGMPRRDFLDEVRYVAPAIPERLNLIDDDLPTQLKDAFSAHPWVERVDSVEIKPPKRVVVALTHRTPVLAVKIGDKVHAVDGQGVLLPGNAPTIGLPVYDQEAPPPKGAAGTRWGDANVEAAARKLRK